MLFSFSRIITLPKNDPLKTLSFSAKLSIMKSTKHDEFLTKTVKLKRKLAHNRSVAGSNPAGPMKRLSKLGEFFFLAEMGIIGNKEPMKGEYKKFS